MAGRVGGERRGEDDGGAKITLACRQAETQRLAEKGGEGKIVTTEGTESTENADGTEKAQGTPSGRRDSMRVTGPRSPFSAGRTLIG
jgi:hypothetical protein